MFSSVLLLAGLIFFGVGLLLFMIFLLISILAGGGWFATIFAFLFVILGGVMLVKGFQLRKKEKQESAAAIRIPAKIYDIVEDHHGSYNGKPYARIVARYFDANHVVREAELEPTFSPKPENFARYQKGITLNIYETSSFFGFDEPSLRWEMLPEEDKLMGELPPPQRIPGMVLVKCPNCGTYAQLQQGDSVFDCKKCNRLQNTMDCLVRDF